MGVLVEGCRQKAMQIKPQQLLPCCHISPCNHSPGPLELFIVGWRCFAAVFMYLKRKYEMGVVRNGARVTLLVYCCVMFYRGIKGINLHAEIAYLLLFVTC